MNGRAGTSELLNDNVTLRAIPLVLIVACLWGGNAVAMKIALRDMPPFILAGLRFALGALIVGFWGSFHKIDLKPRRTEIISLFILSLLFAAQICTFNLGTKFTTASKASIFINIHPFAIAILAHFFIPNDNLSLRKIAGMILAFCGVILVFRDKAGGGDAHYIGDIIILISGFLFSIQTIYTKKLMQNFNVYKLLLWQMVFGLVPFFGLSLIFERSSQYTLSLNLILSLIYQGAIVASIAFIIWTTLLQRYSASKISTFLFTTPLFGIGSSALILQEVVTPYLIVGAILVALGIYIVQSLPGKRLWLLRRI